MRRTPGISSYASNASRYDVADGDGDCAYEDVPHLLNNIHVRHDVSPLLPKKSTWSWWALGGLALAATIVAVIVIKVQRRISEMAKDHTTMLFARRSMRPFMIDAATHPSPQHTLPVDNGVTLHNRLSLLKNMPYGSLYFTTRHHRSPSTDPSPLKFSTERKVSTWSDTSWWLQKIIGKNGAWTHVGIIVPLLNIETRMVEPAVLEMDGNGIEIQSVYTCARELASDYEAYIVPLVGAEMIPTELWHAASANACCANPTYMRAIGWNMVLRAYGMYNVGSDAVTPTNNLTRASMSSATNTIPDTIVECHHDQDSTTQGRIVCDARADARLLLLQNLQRLQNEAHCDDASAMTTEREGVIDLEHTLLKTDMAQQTCLSLVVSVLCDVGLLRLAQGIDESRRDARGRVPLSMEDVYTMFAHEILGEHEKFFLDWRRDDIYIDVQHAYCIVPSLY